MGIDTILMCYILDSQDNDGKPIYAGTMQDFIDEHGKMTPEQVQAHDAQQAQAHRRVMISYITLYNII